MDTSILNLYNRSHMPSLQSNHYKVTVCFVCNVIMPTVRNKFDLTLGYIINYFRDAYHINIIYNKAWNARIKTFTKIFED